MTRSNAARRDRRRRKGGSHLGLAGLMVTTLIVASGASITAAQDTQQTEDATNTPSRGAVTANDDKPAESKPGGTRPTTPAPAPARPDTEAQKRGAKAALPPAPAEKIGAPIEKK